jgi:predicted DNA-binding protein (MmcQ/YjbR family)
MDTETIREHCMSLPHATENLQWGDHLCFKIGGKLFAILPLGPEGTRLTLKASEDSFHELIEVEGIIPAPYLARAKWVALERLNALRDDELRDLLSESYRLVLEKLPAKKRQQLSDGVGAKKPKTSAKKKIISTKKLTSKTKTSRKKASP